MMRTRSGKIIGESSAQARSDDGIHSVTVTWGKEVFRPLQYHSLEIGPFQATVERADGETLQAAIDRAIAELEKAAGRELESKARSFLDRASRLDEILQSEKGKLR